ncbi:RNA-binding protein 12B [Pleurodeles waltl]|uniref:RNA-binding protein 12B n=1 Tax=Pleurodeles waltl TaxID=8319 RepID=UPI003709BE1B
MAVVIRLQGLPVVAGSADIRQFFAGLHIPDGGVHIIGGERGEAFIIFATDEDARRAMGRTGGIIKKSTIQLFLSSKAEMQHTVESNRKSDRGMRKGSSSAGAGIPSNAVTAMRKGVHSTDYPSRPERGIDTNGARPINTSASKMNYGGNSAETKTFTSKNLQYVHLAGMPYTVTEEEVRTFFHGLHLDDIMLLRHPDGRRNGSGIVKFATNKDAIEGLKRNNEYIGARFVKVSPSSEEQWIHFGGVLTNRPKPPRIRSRERTPQRDLYAKHHTESRSPPRKQMRSRSPSSLEFYIHMKNLPVQTDKRSIRKFFKSFDLADTQIKIISTKHNTMDAFVLFKNESDYNRALEFHKEMFNDQRVYIYAISRKSMLEMIEDFEAFERKRAVAKERQREDNFPETRFDANPGSRICMYIRNFPFDVTKLEVQKFFVGFNVHEDDIYLLTDDKGVGLGEALVKFSSEEQAKNAEYLDRRRFLGTEVLLRRISAKQMEEFGLKAFSGLKSKGQDHTPSPYGGKDYLHSVDLRGPDFRSGPEAFNAPADHFRSPRPPMDLKADTFGRARVGRFPEERFTNQGINDFAGGVTKIRLKNVPYTVTVNEILDFFYGYRVIPDSVTIAYTKQGLPTGIAILAVESYEEAIAAIRELNERPIGPRKVSLSLLSESEFMHP